MGHAAPFAKGSKKPSNGLHIHAAFPVKQAAADSLGESLIAPQAGRKLENVTDASLYGLDSSTFTVTASWADGTSTTYAMGDATPFADGYYLSMSGQESTVYTTATALNSLFRKTRSDLAELETIPSVGSVTRITVGSTLDAHYEETSLTINDGQHWYDAENRALDGVEDLVEDAQGIAWDALAEACATEEQLLAWQLDEASATALTLYSGDEPAMALLLGASTDDGSCYARLPFPGTGAEKAAFTGRLFAKKGLQCNGLCAIIILVDGMGL